MIRSRIHLALVVAGLGAALSASRAQPTPTPVPRVVVLIVVDQMRADYFQRYADRFTDGFKTMWDRGAVFTQARYPYASNKTAQAHALMLSGWSPSGTGIVADRWYDRRTGMPMTAGVSPDHKILESTRDGASPEQMQVHTVGDALKAQRPRSIVLAASWKRYTAVLNGGYHADAAFWLDEATGHMVTSDYYTQAYPAWASRFAHTDLTAPFFGTTWLTHKLGADAAPDERYRVAFRATAPANDILRDFAKALFEESGVGTDDDPDLVALSFSALDYAGHEFGPETPEFDTTILAADRQVGDVLRAIEARAGLGNFAVALTADHGAPFLPEKQKERGLDAGRLDAQAFRAAIDQAAAGALRITGPIVAAFEPPELYLNYNGAAAQGVSRSSLDRAVVAAIEAQPGIARAYTVDDIATAEASHDTLLQAVAEGYYAVRSGDIHVLVKPNYMFWGATGIQHGTPYDYDAHVPLILMGSGIKAGKYDRRVRVNDLAPTIGRLLGLDYKGDPKGRVLSEALQSIPNP